MKSIFNLYYVHLFSFSLFKLSMAKQMLSSAQLNTVLFSAQLKAAFFLCHLIVTLWTSVGDILPIQAKWNEATSKKSTWTNKANATNAKTRQPLHHRGILLDNCIYSWSTIWTSCPHWRVSFNLGRSSHWSSYIQSYTQVQFIKTNGIQCFEKCYFCEMQLKYYGFCKKSLRKNETLTLL